MVARGGSVHASLLFAVALVALVGLGLGSSALVGLAAAWSVLLIASRARALGQARVLGAARSVPSTGLEDEAVPVEIALDNRGQRAALFTEILDDFGPALADRQALLEPGPLPGGRRRHLRYRTACSRRWGIYTVGPLRLTTGDPFGLFRGGAVWLGEHHGSEGGVWPSDGLWLFDGAFARVVPHVIKEVTAAQRDVSGTLWVGGSQGLWQRERDGHFRKLPELPAVRARIDGPPEVEHAVRR